MPPNYDPAGLEHWHLVIGAIMNVYALEHSAILRRPLLCSFSQFMGELSFGIYAM
jgi:peptidoglycan/LPS O-acetylase OafA/YrhL